jgi:hypothetical protein
MSRELAIKEQEQIVTASAMLLVEAIEDAGPTALHAAHNVLREQGEDFAIKATKRAIYKVLAKVVKQEARK